MRNRVKEEDVASYMFVTREVVADMGDDGFLGDTIILDGDSGMDNIITLQHIICALNRQENIRSCVNVNNTHPNTGLHYSWNTFNRLLHL